MVNIDPPDEVPSHHTSDYRGLYRECIIPKNEEFEEKVDSLTRTYKDEITKQQEHRRLINFCIYPFAQESSTPAGYRFIRADPLEELGVPNFDFLLYDFEGHMVFGEAKASLPQQIDRIVNEVAEQAQVVDEHEDYIESEYIGQEIRHKEFVLATFTRANELTRKIIALEEDIVTWAVNRAERKIEVNNALPQGSDLPASRLGDPVEEVLDDIDRQISHADNRLNSALTRAETDDGLFDVFPRSGSFDRLRTIITSCQIEGRYTYIDRADIKSSALESMRNHEGEEVEELVDKILQSGLEVGILERWEDDRGQFKVVSQYGSRDGLEKTLKKKWIDYRLEQRRKDLQRECREYALEELYKTGIQSDLDYFFE